MTMDSRVEQFLNTLKHPWDEKAFYFQAFSFVDQGKKTARDPVESLLLEEDVKLSLQIDQSQLQESCSVRNVLKTRRLAEILIDEKGEVNKAILLQSIKTLEKALYSLGPDRQHDAVRQQHILKVLKRLEKDKEVGFLLKKISRPYSHRFAEEIIKSTLHLPDNVPITDAHARRAALAAWLCYLRQNVGSCFATAPAILIQEEQPEQFLMDLNDLLNTGRLKRTYGGVEYSVPMSVSWGAGDLRRVILVDTSLDKETARYWNSPSFIAALEAGGLIGKDDPQEAAREKVLKLLAANSATRFYLSIGDFFKLIFLNHFQLNEEDLKEYESRPRSLIQSNLLIQSPETAVRTGGKGQAITEFMLALDRAEKVFKAYSDNALLKSWEFTLASFSENKTGFTRWNLYASLGFSAQEPGGIGQIFYQKIKEKLDYENQQIQEMEEQYEQIYGQIKYLETRMRGASETELPWIKSEYQIRRNEFYTFEELRNQKKHRAQKFANLFNTLVQIYDYLFPQYFQEVYDADMSEVSAGPFDDSPAGFRLIYKHGRSNTAQWTRIKNPQEYSENLANFFIVTENEIGSTAELEGLETDLTEIVTAVVSHVRTQEFLESSFHRIAKAHNVRSIANPLEHLDQIEKKPWAYTSGGTMETLVSTYYRRDQKPSEAARWVENPMELLVFLLDIIKQIPSKIVEEFKKIPDKRLLMNSPTHAFLFQPGFTPFRKGWDNDAFTYTYVRDHLVAPMHCFVENQFLHDEMMSKLIQDLSHKVPLDYRHYFLRTFERIYGTMRPEEFRDYLVDKMQSERGLQFQRKSVLAPEIIDQVLFENLPLFSASEINDKLSALFREINLRLPKEEKLNIKELLEFFDRLPAPPSQTILGAKQLQNLSKSLLCLWKNKTLFALDYHRIVAESAQALGMAYPKPLIFADTNWVKDYFAFLVNPGTNALELWRVDVLGTEGGSMAVWQQWLNGSRKDIPWSVYHRPYEYVR